MKEKQTQKSWRETFRLNHRAFFIFYKRYPKMVLSHLCYAVWTALTPYAAIFLSAQIINELTGAKNADRLRFLVLLTLSIAALSALGEALLNKWRQTQTVQLWYKMKHIFTEKLFDMDYVNLDNTQNMDLLFNIEQNAQYSCWGLYRILLDYKNLCTSAVTFFAGISLTVSLFLNRVPENAGAYTILNHPIFLFILAGIMLFIAYAAPALSNKGDSYWILNIQSHNLNNRLFNYYWDLTSEKEAAADIRMYQQEKTFRRFYTDKSTFFHSDGPYAHFARGPMGLYHACSAAISVILTGTTYLFVCLKAWAGAFGLGAATQYMASITKTAKGVSGLFETLGTMRNNAAFLEQAFEFLDLPNNMYQGSLTVEKRNDRNYQVEFRNVSFRYPGSEAYALKNVNMKFEVGKRLAVVGMNGSGKTTFIKLLCRLYDPTEGEILLNGINIRKYNYAEYMSIFSVVFQDFKLFSLKLGENVASQTTYDKEKVMDALQKAGFGEKLKEMPDGIDTYLYKDYNKDGINVSGGEAQKIAIARALYKDAPFIILDEPTAALDPIAEAEIYSKFNEIAGDKTAIYISHRLSSCKFCDEIAVFHEGAVIEQGTHDALLADKNGKYYELWHAQAQYYTA